jgi:SsrA-binding protein
MAKEKKLYHGEGSLVATNRRARFEYELQDKLEVGLVLMGAEAKSARMGKVSLADAFGSIKNGEAWIHNMFIDAYAEADRFGRTNTRRDRKLLLHRRELNKLADKLALPGCALVPLRAYYKKGRLKLEVAVGRGKRSYDKRDAIKERDEKRDLDRVRKEWRVV